MEIIGRIIGRWGRSLGEQVAEPCLSLAKRDGHYQLPSWWEHSAHTGGLALKLTIRQARGMGNGTYCQSAGSNAVWMGRG